MKKNVADNSWSQTTEEEFAAQADSALEISEGYLKTKFTSSTPEARTECRKITAITGKVSTWRIPLTPGRVLSLSERLSRREYGLSFYFTKELLATALRIGQSSFERSEFLKTLPASLRILVCSATLVLVGCEYFHVKSPMFDWEMHDGGTNHLGAVDHVSPLSSEPRCKS